MTSLDLRLVKKDNYSERFNPLVYLNSRYKTPGASNNQRSNQTLECLHDFVKKRSVHLSLNHSLRVLDFGCGPVVCNIISAAGLPQVSEIVLADYTEPNLEMIKRWLDKDPSAFDWSPYFKHVVMTLEGKSCREAIKREERVRSLIKLAHCDYTANPPIEVGYEVPEYDIIFDLLCLQVSCGSLENFNDRVMKLSSLLRSGGTLILMLSCSSSAGEQSSYYLDSEPFVAVTLTQDVIRNTLTRACLEILQIVDLGKGTAKGDSADKSYILVCAEKKSDSK